ncbi:MAG: phenylalanine--tRNA ligase subunit beta [Cyclobacteriaceae bacterium]|nr:phenylalanine--tRNA ligase subunit beta [Cyclobacteriaceae bacterium]
MKISLNWLKDYIDLPEKVEQVSDILTATGLEVEKVLEFTTQKGSLEGLVIGEVLECENHPNADKLKLTRVDIGNDEINQIVCGAPNVAKGQKVIVAPVNSVLHPSGGEPFKLKRAKIRGEESNGMICAEDEIGIGEDHSGVIVLQTDLPNGTPATEYFKGYNDLVFEIGLTPNRGDATSHIGVARDLKAVLNRGIHRPSVEGFKPDFIGKVPEVIVENTEACPRYTSVSLENVTVKESPKWLKDKLAAIGIKSINNIVDITNFVLHETGQPLHAFDADAIIGNKVIVKTLKEGSTFTTLDEQERKLADTDLMICNEEEGMCIAGVFGGIKSGIKDSTKRIFLESAYFSADYIRRTSLKHSLKTDAAFRYERGCDPNITVYAAKRAALMMKELAGANIVSEVMDVYPEPVKPFEVKVKFKNIDRLIGIHVSPEKVKEILNHLDIELTNIDEDGFVALVPPYRSDVYREADVIEEVLRIYGFNNIPISKNVGSTYLASYPEVNKQEIVKDLGGLLSSLGFHETITNSLTNPEYAKLSTGIVPDRQVVILNKLSEDLEVMRQTMLFHQLEVVAYNNSHKQNNVKFFEFGKTYHKESDGYNEQNWLSLVVSGDFQVGNWNEKAKKASFFDLSNVVYKVIQKVSAGDIDTTPSSSDILKYGLQFDVNTRPVATIGSVSNNILKYFEIKNEVFYAEINIDKLLKGYKSALTIEEVPKFPEVKRDLSLVLDESVDFGQVEKTAKKNCGFLLKKIDVFDVYRGEKIGEGKKAYAISFILQDKKKTLSEKEIDKTMNRLMQAFKTNLGAIIRE